MNKLFLVPFIEHQKSSKTYKLKPKEFSKCEILIENITENFDINLLPTLQKSIDFPISQKSHVTLGFGNNRVSKSIEFAFYRMKEEEVAIIILEDIFINDDLKKLKIILKLTLYSVENINVLSPDAKFHNSNLLKECGMKAFKNRENETAYYLFSRSLKYLIIINHNNDVSKINKISKIDDITLNLKEDVTNSDTTEQLNNSSSNLTIINPPTSKLNDYHKSNEDLFEISKLSSNLYLNMAACQLNSTNFKGVFKNCCKCLKLDPKNAKALYRRAVTQIKFNNMNEAVQDLSRALEIEPKNKIILQLILETKNNIKKQEQDMHEKLKKLFN